MADFFTSPRPPQSGTGTGPGRAVTPPDLPPLAAHFASSGRPLDPEPAPEAELSDGPPAEAAPPRRPKNQARRLALSEDQAGSGLTAAQRLLLLDTWRRSGLPAGDFAPLVGISKHTLYAWKHKFEQEGPAGLEDKPRGGPTGSRLPRGSGKPRPRRACSAWASPPPPGTSRRCGRQSRTGRPSCRTWPGRRCGG